MKQRTLNKYLRERFGQKVYKLALDGGFTCPNRDGTLGSKGCIFCSAGGSGDFAEDRTLSITQQIENGKRRVVAKELAESGRLLINDRIAKASSEIKVGDIITIEFGHRTIKFKALEIKENASKQDALQMYEVVEEHKSSIV